MEKYIKDNNNFCQDIPYVFKSISYKLKVASENRQKLNCFYTYSAIYDFPKFFAQISSRLSLGFSDITSKAQQMRTKLEDYQILQICKIYYIKKYNQEYINGENNKSLGHGKDQYSKYVSAYRTFLRLLWFLEYLIDIFENMLKDDGKDPVKKILGNSFNKVLAPRHIFYNQKRFRKSFNFSAAGNA